MTKFASGAATHVGQVRQVNQDSVLEMSDDGLFAVADGMGGHRGGEVASEVAIDALKSSFTERTTDALVDAVKSANRAIVSRAKDDPELRGMGTTMCALAKVSLEDGEECLTVVNVGDSRAYLLKSGEEGLFQVSEDHSLVATLVRQGQLTPAEAAVHPQRNILTRALGIDQEVLPDSFALLPVKGDRYLLCSDGLFNEVDENRIADVLRELTDPAAAAEELVRLANEGGGRDNISVVIVDVIDDAGHHESLEAKSDEHRVFEVIHGPERVGEPSEDALIGRGPGADGAGRTRPGAVAGSVAVAAGSAPAVAPPGPAATPTGPSPTRLTWRVGLFVVAFIGIFAAGFFVIQWMATNTYYVGLDRTEVVIYQGRPGGLLWYQPTVVRRSGIDIAQVPGEFAGDIRNGRDQPTLADAEGYLDRIQRRIRDAEAASIPPPTGTTSTTRGIGGEITPGAGGAPVPLPSLPLPPLSTSTSTP